MDTKSGFLVVLSLLLAGQAQAGDVGPAVGPRGPVGPDVALSQAEKKRFAGRVVVDGRSAGAVQAACDRAAKEGVATVFLPAGVYEFEAEVRVPGGLVLLGEGAGTVCRASTGPGGGSVRLFRASGDGVRFTRLKLQGADTTRSTANNTHGILVSGKRNVRIDHCELLGFSFATNFCDEAAAQVDHCFIHHNLRDGLGYGVAIYSGAYVLVMDNEFSQNRHSLASNGALDWNSPKRVGKYLHKPGVRKTHWEFIHNRVGTNDESHYELCSVDTHPGMDGTFVVQRNVFERLRHAVGIRDGSGLIQGNLFRDLRTATNFRAVTGISICYGTHNNVPVDGCMPHNIEVKGNVFEMKKGVKYQKHSVGKAENVTINGEMVPETKTDRPAPAIPRLVEMGEDGVLRWREDRRQEDRQERGKGPIVLPDGTEVVIVGGFAFRRKPKRAPGDEASAGDGTARPGKYTAPPRPRGRGQPAEGPQKEPPEPKVEPETAKLFKRAETLFIEGDLDEAVTIFAKIVREHSDSSFAAKAREYLEITQ